MIFNYSIDAPDSHVDSIAEDLSYNDIETVAELVLEVFLGIDNAIAEHDDNDTDDQNSGFSKKIETYYQVKVDYSANCEVLSTKTKTHFHHLGSFIPSPYLQFPEKPPQV